MNGKTVCISANTYWYLINFRGGLIRKLIRNGCRVVAAAPRDEKFSKIVEALGCTLAPLTIKSDRVSPAGDLLLLFQYVRICLRFRPDVMLLFTMKPIIFGSFACLLCCCRYICTLTGMGSFFLRSRATKLVLKLLLKGSFIRASKVFVQNSEDRDYVTDLTLRYRTPIELVCGSGVNLETFSFRPMRDEGKPIFLLVARIIRDKGICEFFEAAKIIRNKGINAGFLIAGPLGVNNPTSLSSGDFQSLLSDDFVSYLGEVENVEDYIAQASCVVLPSYREGLSRVLLEASAVGRPIITTNVPGCRDLVIHGFNGFLCAARNSNELAEAMISFINLPFSEKQQFGRNSRKLAEQRYNEERVVSAYLSSLRKLFNT